jgi:F420-dependent oxidoreductase-like protein
MRLGLNLGYSGSDRSLGRQDVELAREAEQLGFTSVWVAEAYGSDAVSSLAWIGGQTDRIVLGSAIMQIPARTPAMTAMTAANLSFLTNGRFHLGLGISGPQVSEGWHGTSFANPLGRTSEYVDIVRTITAGNRLDYQGKHFQIPVTPESMKPLRIAGVPPVSDLPIYLAALGPRNIELAGQKCDGWLATFYSPEHSVDQHAAWRKGFAGREQSRPFEVIATVPAVVGPDVALCADTVRGFAALYVGGMGSRQHNFYNLQADRMGYGTAARAIQDLYLSGKREEAESVVPVDLIDGISLLGPWQRVAERMRAFAESGVTTLSVAVVSGSFDERIETLRNIALAAEVAGLES